MRAPVLTAHLFLAWAEDLPSHMHNLMLQDVVPSSHRFPALDFYSAIAPSLGRLHSFKSSVGDNQVRAEDGHMPVAVMPGLYAYLDADMGL